MNLRRRFSEPASLGREQVLAYRQVTRMQDLSVVLGYAGTGKSTMLGEALAAWEAEGYQVRGAERRERREQALGQVLELLRLSPAAGQD